MQGQARRWKINIQNFDHDTAGLSYACDWNFYLDGVLVKSLADNRVCDFTTIIDKKGSYLKAEANLKIMQGRLVFNESGEYVEYVKDLVETITLSQEYNIVTSVDAYKHP